MGDNWYEIIGSDSPYYFCFRMNDVGLIPAVRQTQRSAHVNPRARKYNEQQGSIRDIVVAQMRVKGLNPAPANVRLEARVEVHRKLTTGDCDNFLKAAIDALQGGPYQNDTHIWKMAVQKFKDTEEWFAVEIKEMR